MNKLLFIYFVCVSYLTGQYSQASEYALDWNTVASNEKHERFYEFLNLYKNYPDLDANIKEHFQNEISFLDVGDKVKFYLYNKSNASIRRELFINDVETLIKTDWKASVPTKIFVHGWTSNSLGSQMEAMKNELLNRDEEMNVIALDWGPVASLFYPVSVHLSEEVGKIGSKFIDFLCEQGSKPSDFHVIGLSLGAHVAGFVAANVKAGKVGRATGLDPAYLGFITEGSRGRLDKSDAEFVDCIHTAGETLVAFMKPICHADFYVNGGYPPQPGCPPGIIESVGCSHVRSQDLFTESIQKGHEFPAFTCQIVTKKGPDNCIDKGAVMGYCAERKHQGVFYVETGSKYPFSKY